MKLLPLPRAILMILILSFASLGCNLSSRMAEPTPTATFTATPAPTNTPIPPTATLAPSPTVPPTPAPVEPVATAVPSSTPVVVAPVPTGYAKIQVLRLGAGPYQQAVAGSVNSGTFDRYEVTMAAGESLDIRLTSPQETAGFALLGPDSKPMRGSENGEARWWSSSVNDPGVYAIIIGSELGRAEYNLSVTVTPTGGTTGGAYAALPAKECRQLQNQAQAALGVNFSQGQASFSSGLGEGGTACVLSASGSGQDFESVEAVMSALGSAFSDWSLDKALSADGATGATRGYRRGDDLLLIHVEWRPATGTNCPQGQPIANCNLKPKEKLYSIYIQAARK